MPVTEIDNDTRPCKSCGQPVVWAKSSVSGTATPLDPDPVAATPGTLQLVGDVATPYARVSGDEQAAGPFHVSHFATCPHAGKWRRKGRAR